MEFIILPIKLDQNIRFLEESIEIFNNCQSEFSLLLRTDHFASVIPPNKS